MGSAKSVPVTPARPPPHNKHLARVADPRSPSAGIQRTPIQVESSPQPSLPAREQLGSATQAQDADPRSPTLGISRTPMKTSSGDLPDLLVKQLSDVFDNEASGATLCPGPAVAPEAPSSVDSDSPPGEQSCLEDQRWTAPQGLPMEEARPPREPAGASRSTEKLSRDPETPRPAGADSHDSKLNRRKPNGKVLGRSPLTILQDDNSPGTLTPRQGKRPSPLTENVRELKEGTLLGTGRLLKTRGRVWEQGQEHDKENQHFPLVENQAL
ncbi:cell division cycle-associated protein 3 [Ochotona curzoniae]|uniref:cell division cycle-associated protein 3 n=1 Tax=Ochotona curzoniae TaxID=130825 RepID=UPI001B34E343|nr:cell division cycle-associated protein 3 [Ochotona curzoniae]